MGCANLVWSFSNCHTKCIRGSPCRPCLTRLESVSIPMEFRFKLQLDLGFTVLLLSFISWIPALSRPSLNPMHFRGNYMGCPPARGGKAVCVPTSGPLGERLGQGRTSGLGCSSLASLASPRFRDSWRSSQPSHDCEPDPGVFFFPIFRTLALAPRRILPPAPQAFLAQGRRPARALAAVAAASLLQKEK